MHDLPEPDLPICTDPGCDCDMHTPTVDMVLQEVRAMRADFAQIQATLNTIKEVIEPAVNDLKRSPIGKMMGL